MIIILPTPFSSVLESVEVLILASHAELTSNSNWKTGYFKRHYLIQMAKAINGVA